MTLVKVCGMMRPEDVEMASGADFIGLVVGTGTRRSLSVEQARDLRSICSAKVVMVTTSSSLHEVEALASVVEPNAVQTYRLPGTELVGLREQGMEAWGAVPVGTDGDTALAVELAINADAVVLETPTPQGGGCGRTHDWDRSRALRDGLSCRSVLAGGLTPENVATAIRTVRPDVVDVSSGVEENGRKSERKIASFIAESRRCVE